MTDKTFVFIHNAVFLANIATYCVPYADTAYCLYLRVLGYIL